VRTFYWDPVGSSCQPWRRRRSGWRTGNAGDLLNRVMIRATYGARELNVTDGSGRRLLLVGSVAHRVQTGDLVFGVGTKGVPLPGPDEARCRVVGTRGPITTEAFRRAGHDLADHAFELDPGLLVGRYLRSVPSAEPGRVVYVPHYRNGAAGAVEDPDVHTLSVDADPLRLATEIARAEFVLTSSLHGLVFAHALGRPARLVAPETAEPVVKYQDYFASLGLPWRRLVPVGQALREPKPDSPVQLPPEIDALALPSVPRLREAAIAA
jgi:pyruvyltransferase